MSVIIFSTSARKLNTNIKIAINFVSFQIGWFSCVIMAANGKPEIGIAISLPLVFMQLYFDDDVQKKLLLLLTITLIGAIWDSLLTASGVLVFNAGMFAYYLAPGWIIVMWLLFATTLNISFRWLYGRYWIAMVLGAIFGPLAYQAGSALGAVDIPDDFSGNLILAVGWSFLMPLSIKISEYIDSIEGVRGEVS